MDLIVDDDAKYFRWLEQHPAGYVVNIHREPKPHYAILHRSTCKSISRQPDASNAYQKGAYTERTYVKLCADSEAEALAALKRKAKGKIINFSTRCSHCKP